jgi:hypothetical protein
VNRGALGSGGAQGGEEGGEYWGGEVLAMDEKIGGV